MDKRTVSVWHIAFVGGILFFIHALIPYSHAWPLIWPLMAGIAVAFTGGRITTTVRASLLCAVTYFVLTSIAIVIAPISLNAMLFRGLGIAAVIGFAIFFLAGAVARPFVPKEA